MKFDVIDIASSGGNAVNEDRAGAADSVAWVVDGATDVLAAPIVGESTDAAWFAEALDGTLATLAGEAAAALETLPERAASEIRPTFEKGLKRPLRHRHEYPSAAALILRLDTDCVDSLSLGDCALMIESDGTFVRRGIGNGDGGDPWVASAIRAHREREPRATQAEARAALWSKLRTARDRLNRDDGYGVFSVVPPPKRFVATERHEIRPRARILIASDGLSRLTDVFGRYTPETLLEAAFARGLAALIDELRLLEAEDGDCTSFPRAKVSDDATGLMLCVSEV